MAIQVGIPQAAMNSLIDLVDNVAEVKPGWEVVIVAHKENILCSCDSFFCVPENFVEIS